MKYTVVGIFPSIGVLTDNCFVEWVEAPNMKAAWDAALDSMNPDQEWSPIPVAIFEGHHQDQVDIEPHILSGVAQHPPVDHWYLDTSPGASSTMIGSMIGRMRTLPPHVPFATLLLDHGAGYVEGTDPGPDPPVWRMTYRSREGPTLDSLKRARRESRKRKE